MDGGGIFTSDELRNVMGELGLAGGRETRLTDEFGGGSSDGGRQLAIIWLRGEGKMKSWGTVNKSLHLLVDMSSPN